MSSDASAFGPSPIEAEPDEELNTGPAVREFFEEQSAHLKREQVKLDTGKLVWVRELIGKEKSQWEEARMWGQQSGSEAMRLKFGGVTVLLTRLGLCDKSGKRIYSDSIPDRKAVDKIPGRHIERIAAAVVRLSGLSETSEEAEERLGKSEASEED